MGWTSYNAKYYTRKGTVDRKRECDAYWLEGLNSGHFNVIRSAMVGSTYYATVQPIQRRIGEDESGNSIYEDIPEDQRETFGVVMLTKTDMKDYFNFYYKEMTEDVGPYESKCPKSILDILSTTDSEYALAWRERCREYASTKSLRNLPVGTKIKFYDDCRDREITIIKRSPMYQFKTDWWCFTDKNAYFPKKNIPWDKVTIVTE